MKQRKRMRLPNGFGQISKIKNANLRKPFRAMITVGKTETGRPICRLLKPDAYFKTYNEAYIALMKYHENPYDISEDTTINEIFKRWFQEKIVDAKLSESVAITTRNAWKCCSDIYDIPIRDVRIRHIKYCIENGTYEVYGQPKQPNPLMKTKIKETFNKLFDYAIEYGLVERNFARDYKLSKDITKEASIVGYDHIAYTDDEILLLWKNIKDPVVDAMLVQCYSGWRPQELLNLELENINLEELTFTGGLKTEAGKNRIVPIHSAIADIVKRNYRFTKKNKQSRLFLHIDGYGKLVPWTYGAFNKKYKELIDRLKLNEKHRPHDGRKYFVTQAKKYNLDEYAIKRIIGHSISDLTERVYTERPIEWLREEIEKIVAVVGMDEK